MKAAIIGAGSAFGGRLSVDILSHLPLQDSSIALCDIDTLWGHAVGSEMISRKRSG